MNILAVAAHPDDVEYYVAGTLLKYKKQGHKIFIALTTSGNTGSNIMTDTEEIARVREAEALEAAKFYDAEVRFMRNDDERLLDTDQTRTQVLDALRWADPDVIFTHSPDDESPDHAMTSHLVRAMIQSMPGRNQRSNLPPVSKRPSLFFWDHGMGAGFMPDLYVDITEEMDTKFQALQVHESQKSYMADFKSLLGLDMKILGQSRGWQFGCAYAEAFRVFRLSGYISDYRVLPR